MLFQFENLGRKYHINANFCYYHFILYIVLKTWRIQQLLNVQGIAYEIFLFHINTLLFLFILISLS